MAEPSNRSTDGPFSNQLCTLGDNCNDMLCPFPCELAAGYRNAFITCRTSYLGPKSLPEGARGNNGSLTETLQHQEVVVTCDDILGASRLCQREDRIILRVTTYFLAQLPMTDGLHLGFKKTFDSQDLFLRHLQLFTEIFRQFLQDELAKADLVLIETDLEQLVTNALRGKRGYQYVAVKNDPHEMLLNTSSSVRRPCASANGIDVFRRRRNV